MIYITSQVLISSKKNVVLVSDKAVTIENEKTYDGINKIFPISDIHSSALMYNGKCDFEEVPIELLINGFCQKTDFENIKTIEEIKDKMIDYFSKNTPKGSVENFIKESVQEFKSEIEIEILKKNFKRMINQKSKKRVNPLFKNYSNYDREFYDIIPQGYNKKKYNKLLWKIFSYDLQYYGTGIILTGYDLSNDFPTILEFDIFCKDGEKIIYNDVFKKINYKEPLVRLYAINEEAYTFITGVNEDFIDFILDYVELRNIEFIFSIKEIFKKENIQYNKTMIKIIEDVLAEIYSDITKKIEDYRNRSICDTSYSIENLPEWLICLFAEHLIKETAIKQKTTSQIESVSIDSDAYVLKKYVGCQLFEKENSIF